LYLDDTASSTSTPLIAEFIRSHQGRREAAADKAETLLQHQCQAAGPGDPAIRHI
jgi:hypothetical protein